MRRRGDPPAGISKNVHIAGRRTSLRLEPAYWDALAEACRAMGVKRGDLLRRIDAERGPVNLSGAVRIWLLRYYRDRTKESEVSNSNLAELWAALYAIYDFVQEEGRVGALPNKEMLGPEPYEMAAKIIEAIASSLTRDCPV